MFRRGLGWFWVIACAVLFVGQVPFAVIADAEEREDVVGGRVYDAAWEVPGLPSEVFSDPVVRSDPPAELEMSPVVELDPDATVGEELVERRSSHSRVFSRSDGLVEVQVSPEPVAFEAGDGGFELIDTAVREGRGGGLVADRNSFTVSFGDSGSGVVLELPSGRVIRSVPLSFDGVSPESVVVPLVDESDPSLVWYRDVWPGVDLRYRVTATGLSEDVVFQRPQAGAGAVQFSVSGAELDSVWREPAAGDASAVNKDAVAPPSPRVTPAASLALPVDAGREADGGVEAAEGLRAFADADRPSVAARASLVARGELAGEVSFGPVVALSGADEMPVLDPAAAPLVRSRVAGEGESIVEVSVDPGWLAAQPADAYPIVLDPDVIVGSNGHRAYLNVLGTECGSGGPWCWLRAGYPAISGYPFSVWRTVFGVDMSAEAANHGGLTGSGADKVFAASLVFNREGGYSGSSTLKLHTPTAWSWAGAVAGGQLASTTGTSAFTFDRTAEVKAALAGSTTGFAWGISADPVGSYNFKDLGVMLSLTVNDAPPAPTIAASSQQDHAEFFASTIDAVPTLAVDAVTDTTLAPGHSAVEYHFSVASNAFDTTQGDGDIATWSGTSPTLPGGQITASQLKDGHTYYWRVWADDGFGSTPSPLYRFTFDRRLGTGGPSPMVDVGPVSVNAATGNMVFGWSSRQVNTLGGGAGVSLSYNSLLTSGTALLEATPGLPAGWRGSWGELPVTSLEFTDDGSAVVRMTDGSRQSFDWDDDDARWEAVEENNYALFTEVGSGYQWQTTGGWTVVFDSTGAIESASNNLADDTSPTALEYSYDTGTPKKLTSVTDPVTGRTIEFHYGGGSCPASAPAGLTVAPSGLEPVNSSV